jgi:hypothetical protein
MMSRFKIVLDLCFDEGSFYVETAKILRDKYGWDVSMLAMGKRWLKEAESAQLKTNNIGAYIKERLGKEPVTPQRVSRIEDEYGDPFVTSQVFGDRFFSENDNRTVVEMTLLQYEFLEKLFDEEKPDIFLIPGTAHALHIFIERLCKKRGVRYFAFYSARILPGLLFSTEYAENWTRVDERFAEIKKSGLSGQEREWAKGWLEEFMSGGGKPYYMKIAWPHPGFRFEFLREFVKRLNRVYILGHGGKDDYVTPNPFRSAIKNFGVIFKKYYLKLKSPFENMVAGEKYILFPLHLQPEASTIIMAPEYIDQLVFVENASRSIPLGHYLYVKEHPNMLGKRAGGYYERLKKNFNVRLIDPSADNREIIIGAELVLNLTGTAGLEAALLGKKVINCGLPPFRNSPLCVNQRDITKLKSTVRDLLEKQTGPDQEDILAYIMAVRDASHAGFHNLPHKFPSVMEKGNIDSVAEAVVNEYRYFKGKD